MKSEIWDWLRELVRGFKGGWYKLDEQMYQNFLSNADEIEADFNKLQAENNHLKALIEEILVENVGCTELRDLYRRKVRGGK